MEVLYFDAAVTLKSGPGHQTSPKMKSSLITLESSHLHSLKKKKGLLKMSAIAGQTNTGNKTNIMIRGSQNIKATAKTELQCSLQNNTIKVEVKICVQMT